MLTVDKLVKIKEYEDLQETIKKERLNKITEAIDMFKGIENEDEWKQKKEEIRHKKETEMEKRILYYKNKKDRHYISETQDKKNKETQKKVLEHRQRLQKMHDERVSRQHKN